MGKLKDLVDDLYIMKRYSRTFLGLILFLAAFLLLWFTFLGNPFLIDQTSSVDIKVFSALVFGIVSWWFINRINEKVALGKEVKIGFAFYTDDRKSIDRIIAVVHPIIRQLKREKSLDFTSFVLFEPNEIKSSESAKKYCDNNQFGIENLLWLKIEFGEIEKSEKLIITEGLICLKNVHKEITFHGISVNLNKELNFIKATSNLSYIEVNEFFQKEQLKKALRQIILYLLGVSCILRMKFPEALSLLKAIYIPEDSIIGSKQMIGNTNCFTISHKNLLAARLTNLLSGVYTQVSCEYQKRGDFEKAYRVCTEAEEQLGRIPPAYWIFVQLARLSYQMNKVEDAKIYTEKMESSVRRVTDEVILNKAFFSIIDQQIDKVVFFYKKLSPEMITCNVVEVVAFLHSYNTNVPTQSIARDYAVGVLTTYYLCETEGKQQLNSLMDYLSNDKIYTKMRNHIKRILTTNYNKVKQTA